MHCAQRALTAALVVAVGLVASATASANRLSMSGQFFRITWGELNLTTEGGSSTRCPATLEGSFHAATFAKSGGALIGLVTRATVGSCTSGTVTFLMTTPWHVQYETFVGTLPEIRQVNFRFIGAAIEWSRFLSRCLYTSEAGHPMQMLFGVRETTGEILWILERTGSIPASGCVESVSFTGIGVVKNFSTQGGLWVTLI